LLTAGEVNEKLDGELSETSVYDEGAAMKHYDYLIAWTQRRMALIGFDDAARDDAGQSAIVNFITGEGTKTLYICRTSSGVTFSVHSSGASSSAPALEGLRAYFLRTSIGFLTTDNVDREVQYGSVSSQGSGSGVAQVGAGVLVMLERLMKGLVEKQVSSNSALTDGARNELTAHFHRCMATLTDAVHFGEGKTILYCPKFNELLANIAEASLNKDLVQVMESIVIHWTRQIKDVVNNHDNSASAETSGPLD